MKLKRCPRCQETMAADLTNFAPRDKRGRLDGWCRICRSEDQIARYHRRKQLTTPAQT
jgi:hypothetical protein